MEPSEIKAMQDYRETEQLAGSTLEMEMFRVAIKQATKASDWEAALMAEDPDFVPNPHWACDTRSPFKCPTGEHTTR